MQIKSLFDPAKDIYRTIEKVITYSASQETRLKAEITEYVVTDRIEAQFEKLLDKMQAGMEAGGQHEIGVWVSGFYGSGKSSFTKYLGLALDERVQIDGVRFLKYLQDRLNKPQTKAVLATVASRYPAAVVLLDLASDMVAGATMEEVSTVLYYKVLQWAGYSRNLKVAAFERLLKKDGRYQEFTDQVQREYDIAWKDAQNDPLVLDSVVPAIAHAMYPDLFRSATAFTTDTVDIVRFETERVKEMIDIVRETSGRQHILFIIDEVGQYVGSRPNLILNLDGLAKNLKQIGDGKVWIFGTAQQTLTEDAPRAFFNSPELYKLKDRFPIPVDLESNDIKEICYRRLLGKSPDGEQVLRAWFVKYGQVLRQNTRLYNAKSYDAEFDEAAFVRLYPFLPAHFDVLLYLLGNLAKSTGGIGLRSAIKVIQDILVEGPDGRTPVADHEVGWLATTVTLYDALEKDIRRAAPSIHKAVGKALVRFPDSAVHQEVAKTVAILQILGTMPVTAQNVTSLMHPGIDAPSREEAVAVAIADLTTDGFVPFGEKDGNLCFFSEKINDIDQERAQIPLRAIETRRILSETLRDVYNPLPSVRLQGSLSVKSGLKVQAGSNLSSLAGERETIQTIVGFATPEDYEAARARMVEESRDRGSRNTVFLLGRTSPDIDIRLGEIFRCREIAQRYRGDPEGEVKEYCTAQSDRATKLTEELQHQLAHLLSQGSFIFRAETTAVDSMDHDLLEAARKHLATVAAQVFDRYGEAPHSAETALAEKFLKAGRLQAVTSAIDPLDLVRITAGVPRINMDHKAVLSVKDYLSRNGTVEGKRLTDVFTDAPFGWSPDTLRYLVAAMLWAGEIKLKVSGHEITAVGQQAIDALKTNNTFKPVGVALRGNPLSQAVLARAAERLRDLTGEDVIPLEDEISKLAVKRFPQFQAKYGPLATKLEALDLPGGDAIRAASQELANALLTDGSDVPDRLGGEVSSLYDALKWAAQTDMALNNGLEATVRELREYRREILGLPQSGVPGQLRADLGEHLAQIGQILSQLRFFDHTADLNSALTAIQARTRDAAIQMGNAQRRVLQEAEADLQRLPEWMEFTQEEQATTLAHLDELDITGTADLHGLRSLLRQDYVIQSRVAEARRQIRELANERRLHRLEEEKSELTTDEQHLFKHLLRIPASVTSIGQMQDLIRQLQELSSKFALYKEIDVTIEIEE